MKIDGKIVKKYQIDLTQNEKTFNVRLALVFENDDTTSYLAPMINQYEARSLMHIASYIKRLHAKGCIRTYEL